MKLGIGDKVFELPEYAKEIFFDEHLNTVHILFDTAYENEFNNYVNFICETCGIDRFDHTKGSELEIVFGYCQIFWIIRKHSIKSETVFMQN